MRQHFDVVVVGGGIIGCAIAAELAQAGVQVAVLEREEAGGVARTAAAGILAPIVESKGDPAFLALALPSAQAYPAFAAALTEESGVDATYARSGILHVALTDDEATRFAQEAAALRTQ